MQMAKLRCLCGDCGARSESAMRIALFQPEIAGNVGAVMRLGACFGVAVDLIEPLGFAWDDKRVRRTAMDYIDHVAVARHVDFWAFHATVGEARLILMTTKVDATLYDFVFKASDILLFGQESAGVPATVAAAAAAAIKIPLRRQVRSFNLATAAAITLGEALRQTQGLPG